MNLDDLRSERDFPAGHSDLLAALIPDGAPHDVVVAYGRAEGDRPEWHGKIADYDMWTLAGGWLHHIELAATVPDVARRAVRHEAQRTAWPVRAVRRVTATGTYVPLRPPLPWTVAVDGEPEPFEVPAAIGEALTTA